MLICMDVFILFVDDHRIALDEEMIFNIVLCRTARYNAYCCYPKYLTGKYGSLEVANICIRYYK